MTILDVQISRCLVQWYKVAGTLNPVEMATWWAQWQGLDQKQREEQLRILEKGE